MTFQEMDKYDEHDERELEITRERIRDALEGIEQSLGWYKEREQKPDWNAVALYVGVPVSLALITLFLIVGLIVF